MMDNVIDKGGGWMDKDGRISESDICIYCKDSIHHINIHLL